MIYVSHAVEEVTRLAAKVVRLAEEGVVASGTPTEVLFLSDGCDHGPVRSSL